MPASDPLPDISQKFHTIGVIVGRDLVGDALIKLPFLRALRRAFPKAEIHWITSDGPTAYGGPLRAATRDLIDIIDETPEWLRARDQGLGVREKILHFLTPSPRSLIPHFDLLIDTRNRWHRALEARRIPHKLFLAMAASYLFSDKGPSIFQPRPAHIIDRLLQMVELAAGYMPPSTGALTVPEDILQRARTILPKGKTYIGLAPGAGNPVKIWPRYKFEKLAALQASKGRIPVFILGPQELDWYDELTSTVPTAKFPLQDYDAWGTAQLAIDHTLAIASLLDAAVANDSGVGHMLAAADCRLISLFGPTSAVKLAPRVSHGLVIRAQDFGSSSMNAITWETVDAAVDRMLH